MPTQPAATPRQHGKILHRWGFPEFVRYQRSRRWYTVVGLIVAGSFVWAVFQGNVLFAIILILAAIVYVTLNQRRPRNIICTIEEDGVSVDRDFFPWDDLGRFWVVYQPPEVKKLFFRFRSSIRPIVSVLLEKENPVSIRKTLLEYLAEDPNGEEPGSDQFSRVFKL